jgi:uncharacterized protein YeaO (DUF488 family)
MIDHAIAMALDVRTKRIYDDPEPGDGYRVLVDHVWPRGISRERAALDEWARELAPSDALRRWFGHVPERFAEFRERYRGELAAHGTELDELRSRARSGPLTVVYAARDRDHNNGVVVAELLRDG